MYPHMEDVPVSLFCFPEAEGVLDAVYNPLRSNLVLDAKEEAFFLPGLYMLSAQAVFACGLFLNRTMRSEDMDRVYQYVLSAKQNIVLCGMPSCGKTTVPVGWERFRREVLDTDEMIIKHNGMPIAEFSARYGEHAFRDLESEAVKEAASEAGKIIATGGGAVLRKENVRALKQKRVVVFIDRPLGC